MIDYVKREDVKQMLCSFCREPKCHSVCNVPVIVGLLPAADVVERPRWIPVTERLPKYGDWVLGIGTRHGYHVCEYRVITHFPYSGDSPWFSAKGRTLTITHWMPLPEPPKEVENENI